MIVHGFQPLTIITKCSILDVASVLDHLITLICSAQNYCIKSVGIWISSGPYFAAFSLDKERYGVYELNTERYGVYGQWIAVNYIKWIAFHAVNCIKLFSIVLFFCRSESLKFSKMINYCIKLIVCLSMCDLFVTTRH